MKILLINSVCGIGSTGRIAVQIAEEYEANGYECRIAYGRKTVPDKYKKYAHKIGTTLGNYISALKVRIFDNEGLNNYFETKKFLKWASEFDPDILWLHNIHGYYINYPLLFKWISSRPGMKVYWTLHDCWAFTGHCSYFTIANCNKWTYECSHCTQKHAYPCSLLMDHSKRNYNKKRTYFTLPEEITVICVSEWLKKHVSNSFFSRYPIIVKENTVDTTIFKPVKSDFRKQYGLENKIVLLGVASNWTPRKGLADFVWLSKKLDDSFQIVLVGLTKKEKGRHFPKNIITIGRTNNPSELAEIYSAADIYLNLSKEETFGLTTLEAVSCGTRTIVYKGTACEEVARQHRNCDAAGSVEDVYDMLAALKSKTINEYENQ